METTSTNPETGQILELAAIYDDLENPKPIGELPRFKKILIHDGDLTGNPYALNMNAKLIKATSIYLNKERATQEDLEFIKNLEFEKAKWVTKSFKEWLLELGYPLEGKGKNTIFFTAAGKNFGTFDLQFLKRLEFWTQHFYVRHRIIDVGSMFFEIGDDALPDLDVCASRGKINQSVTHEGMNDAEMVIKLIRKFKNLPY